MYAHTCVCVWACVNTVAHVGVRGTPTHTHTHFVWDRVSVVCGYISWSRQAGLQASGAVSCLCFSSCPKCAVTWATRLEMLPIWPKELFFSKESIFVEIPFLFTNYRYHYVVSVRIALKLFVILTVGPLSLLRILLMFSHCLWMLRCCVS